MNVKSIVNVRWTSRRSHSYLEGLEVVSTDKRENGEEYCFCTPAPPGQDLPLTIFAEQRPDGRFYCSERAVNFSFEIE